MKTLFTLCFSLLFTVQLFAQTRVDSIEVKKGFSTTFRQNGRNLTPKQLQEITQSNPEAKKEMQLAQSKNVVASILGTAGGALIGWPVGAALGGGEPNWTLAGVGAGLVAIGIPFSASYVKHATKAVQLYNGGQMQSSVPKLDVKLGFTGNGLGLNMKF
jgi:hypothetical protein